MELSSISASISYTSSWKASKKEYQLTHYDPNRKFQSFSEANDYGVALGNTYAKEYSEICSNCEFRVNNIEDLKKEINALFPQYTMVSSKPSDAMAKGRILLYIDQANLQKMVSNPNYKTRVYGLMQRETLGFQGSTYMNIPFVSTGLAFTLCNENTSYDGIPYRGVSYGMRVNQTTEFKAYGTSIQILAFEAEFEEKLELRVESAKNSKSSSVGGDKSTYEFANADGEYADLWEQARLDHQGILLQREMDFQKRHFILGFEKRECMKNTAASDMFARKSEQARIQYEKNLA